MRVVHWEGDTVIGRGHKQAIVSLVERKSSYAVIRKVSNKTSDLVSAAIIESLTPMTDKGAVKAVRRFLQSVGVEP